MMTNEATSAAPERAPLPPSRPGDRRRALALFLLLWTIYVATASGRFHSDDEMSVFAVAASLVGRGEVTIDQIAWNQDLGGGVGRALDDGRVYSKYGLGGALAVAPLIAAASAIPWAGAVAMATLLNGPLTAATAALLYLSGRRLGFSPAASVLAALSFGLATFAWVYARYLFGEPIVAFSWMLAFWLLLGRGDVGALGAGVATSWAILVRTASAVSAPLFLPLLLARRSWRARALFLLPNLLVVAAVGLYNAARFGNPFDSGYNPIERFTAPLGEGTWGLLLSPGRGIIWYAPPVLLAVIGAPLLLRRKPAAGGAALLLVAANLFVFGTWHAWHGGWGWGPRLILPVVPFLLVLALPVFGRAVVGGSALSWVARLAVGGLFFLGVAVTVLGVLVDFNQPLLALLADRPELGAGVLFLTLADWHASPIVAHLALLPQVAPDLVWLSGGLAWPLAAVSALAVLLALRLVAVCWPGEAGWPALAVFSAVTTLAVALAGTNAAYAIGRLSPAGREIAAAVELLRAEARAGDRLVVVAVGEAEALLNRLPPWLPAVQILPEAEPLSPLAEARLARAAAGARLWLLQRSPHPAGEDNGIEARLDQLAYKRETQTIGEVELTRYLVAPAAPLTPVAIDFGDRLRLTGWAARVVDETLLLDLQWLALRPPGARYIVSVRLVDSETRVQRDREPTDGARPTDVWRSGETVRERLGLALPAGLPAGVYRLQLVVYPAGGGRPLLVGASEVATVGEFQRP